MRQQSKFQHLVRNTFKHKRLCFTTFPSAEKRVENMACSGIFLTNFNVFGNGVRHCIFFFFELSFQSKLKLKRENGEIKWQKCMLKF